MADCGSSRPFFEMEGMAFWILVFKKKNGIGRAVDANRL
jgi:hypothetical protein